jgi:hypothetical protein
MILAFRMQTAGSLKNRQTKPTEGEQVGVILEWTPEDFVILKGKLSKYGLVVFPSSFLSFLQFRID